MARKRWSGLLVLLALAAGGCVGNAYLPDEPGSSLMDLSGVGVRAEWVAAHPDADERIRDAIQEGVFVTGMSREHIDVLSNPNRSARTGRAYWRRFESDSELRLHWYVAGERETFEDGRARRICELVLREDVLRDVRYCDDGADAAASDG